MINLCHNIIVEDICVERLLRRLYDIERIYDFIISEDKNFNFNYYNNNRFDEIYKLLYNINNEIKTLNFSIRKKKNSVVSNDIK